MRTVSVVGARPQFVKLAPVDRELRARGHEHRILHTGQHYDYELSLAFYEQLEIPVPHIDLEVGSGSHGLQTGQMLSQIDPLLRDDRPDLVIVYGDTNSTLAGALAAVKLHIPVVHVEAGYRSDDISMPEEVNRVLVDRMAQLLLAPTPDAVVNLRSEGIDPARIIFVGNIMAESLLANIHRVDRDALLNGLGLHEKGYFVLTAHRPENTNDRARLASIIDGMKGSPLPIIFPAHPRTAKLIEHYGLAGDLAATPVRMIPPLKYLDFISLESAAAGLLTDSGGVQEEALILGVPCLTLRYNTERKISIELGRNKLVGTVTRLISEGLERLAGEATLGSSSSTAAVVPEKWDTGVSARIVDAIEDNAELLKIEPHSEIGQT